VHVNAPLTSVLGTAYAPEHTTEAWLAGIQREVSSAFGGHLGVQAFIMRTTDDTIDVEAVVAHDKSAAELLIEQTRVVDAHVVAIMKSSPVLRTSRLIKPGAHPVIDVAAQRGLTDSVGAVGFADANRACVVSFHIDLALPSITRVARTALGRLAAHLGSAYRLRIGGEPAGDGDAVLTPDGALLHANDEEVLRSRDRLRQAAMRIARSKRAPENDPAGGLAFWTAMVEGRWTLVERTETDGKRLLIARRNAPGTRGHRALSQRERAVLERASYGSSLRHVAYELGMPESTVCESLARAMAQLGIRNRAELIELHSAVVGSENA
jgi:DNA-binding CsgD family transcriptional regulator